jgi:Ni,Fe-hydrogenase III small subunit
LSHGKQFSPPSIKRKKASAKGSFKNSNAYKINRKSPRLIPGFAARPENIIAGIEKAREIWEQKRSSLQRF